jgi:hypothetical protein
MQLSRAFPRPFCRFRGRLDYGLPLKTQIDFECGFAVEVRPSAPKECAEGCLRT